MPRESRLPVPIRNALPEGRILEDPATRLVYEYDAWSIVRNPPLAVAFPESTAEVRNLVRACIESGVAWTARGAGTCLSGGATPSGGTCLLIETSRMDRILSLDPEDRIAVVQPGRINLELSRAAAPFGLHFAPDPSSQSASTLGGNLAENAGGPHCFKYGMTTDHVLGLTLVDGEGEVCRLHRDDGLDLCGLVVGSEGTFGVLTECELRLIPTPTAVRTFLASFSSMEAACRAVAKIVSSGTVPAALEILDRLSIEAVEASVFAAGYPKGADAVLLVELDGEEDEVEAERIPVLRAVQSEAPLEVEETSDPEQRARLWRGRKGAFGAMGRLKPDLFVLDGVVPPSKLAAVLAEITAIGREQDILLSNVFHAGDGNLHPNLSFDGRNPGERERAMEAGRRILKLCVDAGGSISGEHGIGFEKIEHLSYLFSPTDLEILGEVRRCFDPAERCNPGKVLPLGRACGEGSSARRPGILPSREREDP